jgi:hypothetical protein
MTRPRDRPTKICAVCGRSFQWRRKWKDVWDEVRYCSERCRRDRHRLRERGSELKPGQRHHWAPDTQGDGPGAGMPKFSNRREMISGVAWNPRW